MKKYLLPVLIFFVCFLAVQQAAAQETSQQIETEQESAEPEQTEGQQTEPELTREQKILEQDIGTSSLMELAVWCRSLGLSEGGTRDDLANRLRNYFGLPLGATQQASQTGRTITIESARTTEYFTIETVDEEYARLRGDVAVSLRDGDAVHRITAWEILYNRTRNVLTASGGVVYIKEEGTTIETFRGESITVNLDNWSGIFLDGVYDRSLSESDTAYRFSGTVISTNDEGATVLTGAEITNAHNEEAFWSLYTSKLWLLPGSDFAFVNGVLKVGNIPVLWIPAFYFPMDEIIFHPVLGSRPREGTFLQTTTYILGRPKSQVTMENSITKIFGSSADGEKEQVGLFLRTTSSKTVSPDLPRLSVLLDAYTNLGFYLGTELALPPKDNFGEFELSFGLGLTRNIYQVSYGYTPFLNFDGTDEWFWDELYKPDLFGIKIPVRFRMEMKGSVSFAQGSLSWNIPLYSDPYMNRDFMNRSEVLDWLSMIREGADSSSQQTSNASLSSYELRLSGSFRPRITDLSPYITSLSLSNIYSSLSFASKATSPAPPSPSNTLPNPNSMFFYPNEIVLFSVNASMAGTPYTTSQAASAASRTVQPNDDLLPSPPVSPWAASPEEDSRSSQSADDVLVPPVLNQQFSLTSPGSPRLVFNYTLNPGVFSRLQYLNSNWNNSEDIDWSEVSSILTRVRADTSLGLSLSQTGSGSGLYSGSLRLTGTGTWQGFNYLNENTPDISRRRRDAYGETGLTSSYDFTATLRPFYQNTVWRNTSIQYDLRGLLARTVFDGTKVIGTLDEPEWKWEFAEWTNERLTANTISARLEASIMDQVQNLTVSAVLPPMSSRLTGTATFRFWISETQIRNTIVEPFDNDKRVIQPLYFTETLKFTNQISLEQYLAFDPDINELTAMSTTFKLGDFSARFLMSYAAPYSLNYGPNLDPAKPAGWFQAGDKILNPQELNFSYNYTYLNRNFLNANHYLSFNFNTSLNFDLQRYTYSKFTFSFGIDLRISKFIDIKLSASSENAQIYWYFRDLPIFASSIQPPPTVETNLFVDLLNSFRFDNDDLRRSSAFKLKNFKLDIVHHLGDWDVTLGITLSPYLDRGQNPPTWKFNNDISFLIRWIPIEEIRTEIAVNRDQISFK